MLTESGFMEKTGIEPATPGVVGMIDMLSFLHETLTCTIPTKNVSVIIILILISSGSVGRSSSSLPSSWYTG